MTPGRGSSRSGRPWGPSSRAGGWAISSARSTTRSAGRPRGPELPRGGGGDLQRWVGGARGGAAAVPLWLRGRAVAVRVCDRRPDQALEPLARQAAAAIELADRYTDVLHRARRVRRTTPAAEGQENLLPPRHARLDDAEPAAGSRPPHPGRGGLGGTP